MAMPRRPVPYVCEQCGAQKITTPSTPRRFCSRACKNIGLSGTGSPHYRHGLTDTPEMKREYARRFFERHPGRKAIKDAVKDAIRSGLLVRQPCEVCGKTRVHAHHDDYSKPLSVRWLCQQHHWDIHRAERAEAKRLRDLGRLLKEIA